MAAPPAPTPHAELRAAVVAAARRLGTLGLDRGTSGNVSLRAGAGLLITPSGVAGAALTPDRIVWMDLDGRHGDGRQEKGGQEGGWRPSSEWRFHCAILRSRPELNAVVHSHAIHATALACHGRGIPAFHYTVAAAGGPDIRCAPYATFGTAALAANALAALEGRRACLLANHGLIACGRSLDRALALAVEVETLAAMYLKALALGPPDRLDDAEMHRVVQAFATYGQPPEPPRER